MRIFLITIITLVITFLLNPIFRKINKKRPIKPAGRHIHHSVAGMVLLAIGAIMGSKIVSSVGLGIYLGHVAEEIYFNKRNLFAAFLIFVTR